MAVELAEGDPMDTGVCVWGGGNVLWCGYRCMC